MRKRLASLGAAVLGALFALSGSATASAAPAPAAPCSHGQYCEFSGPGFSGAGFLVGDLQQGHCYGVPHELGTVRSYWNYGTGEEEYYFSGPNCTGESAPVAVNSESADLGFNAVSMLAECVSCLSRP